MQWLSAHKFAMVLRHRASGLALLLPEGSTGWCMATARGSAGYLADASHDGIEQTDFEGADDAGHVNELVDDRLPADAAFVPNWVPLLDYLREQQPNLEGHFIMHGSFAMWGFSVTDDGRLALCNSIDVAHQSGVRQDDHAGLLAFLRSTPSVYYERILDLRAVAVLENVR